MQQRVNLRPWERLGVNCLCGILALWEILKELSLSLIQIINVWHTWLLTLHDGKLIIPEHCLLRWGRKGEAYQQYNCFFRRSTGSWSLFMVFADAWKTWKLFSTPHLFPGKMKWQKGFGSCGWRDWACTYYKGSSPVDHEPSKCQRDSQTLDRNFSRGNWKGWSILLCKHRLWWEKRRRGEVWSHGSQ